ncbi:MAG: hypothetical protein ACI97A_000409 [Planctomycetota bacterium]
MATEQNPVARYLDIIHNPDGSTATEALGAEIHERFGDALSGIIFYGSVLHGLAEKDDALHDMLVVVTDYTSAFPKWSQRLANWILPPNVFYLETEHEGREYRCKYAVVSIRDFDRYTKMRCRQVYFWGRYCQPTSVTYSKDGETQRELTRIRAQAVTTFARRTMALRNPAFTVSEFWVGGLSACYGCELRPEDTDRAERIVGQSKEYYRTMALLALSIIGAPVIDAREEDAVFHNPSKGLIKQIARWGWKRRKFEGKILNLLRLMKAVFTFDGGVDYALWKIGRHSGIEVQVSDRVRKHPLLFGWPTFWRLWRQGVFSKQDRKEPTPHE